MSDEQRKDEEVEVEGHVRRGGGHGNEPSLASNDETDVAGHMRRGHVNEEPAGEDEGDDDDDVEAHIRSAG